MRLLPLILAIALSLTACDFTKSNKPSVLVVAVEGLDFNSVPCLVDSDELSYGLRDLCRGAVRFTRAFTPSLMSKAALASVLTGLYPVEHKLRHNGKDFLSEDYETVAEAAHTQNYRTALFSGGAPILANSGLGQGFELFDDNLKLALGRYYRDAGQTTGVFLRWLEKDVKGSAFFSLLYLADLQFPNVSTVSDAGEVRALGRQSQLKEIDESLGVLFHRLKESGRWHNTYVFVMGLNGRSQRAEGSQVLGNNLHSENTQVSLFIKPATSERDAGIEWAIDANVSLVDIGVTLKELFLGSSDTAMGEALVKTSLIGVLKKPTVDWSRDRVIYIESAWPLWRELSDIKISARKQHWLYIQGEKPQIYNTLTDSAELQPLSFKDFSTRELYQDFSDALMAYGVGVAREPSLEELQKIYLLGRVAAKSQITEDERLGLRHLAHARPWDAQLSGVLASLAIANSDWAELKSIGERYLNKNWVYLALRMLGESDPNIPPCFAAVLKIGQYKDDKRICDDEFVAVIVNWLKARGSLAEAAREEELVRKYRLAKIEEDIANLNFQNGLIWDAQLTSPGEPMFIDLALLLPEFKHLRLVLKRNKLL
jgi:hypothetical protein